jgi:hypothetical protein
MVQSQTQNARRLASKRSRKLLGAAVAAVGPVIGVSKWASAQLYTPYLDTSDSAIYRDGGGHLIFYIELSNGGSYNVGQDTLYYAIDTVDTNLASATNYYSGSGWIETGSDGPSSHDPNSLDIYCDVTEDNLYTVVDTTTDVTTWWVWLRVGDSDGYSNASGAYWFDQY